MRVAASTGPVATAAPIEAGALLQRKCACGGTPGPTPDAQIVGHTEDGQTILRDAGGTRTTRPSVEGDNHLSEPPRLEGVSSIEGSQWSCP